MRLLMPLLAAALAFAPAAFACKCAFDIPFAEHVARAETIVHARIDRIEDRTSPAMYARGLELLARGEDETYAREFHRDAGVRLHYTPLTFLKGDTARAMTVDTGYGGGDCGLPFTPGMQVLLFITADGIVSSCGGSREYAIASCAAQQTLDRLGTMIAAGAIDPAFALPNDPYLLLDDDVGGKMPRWRGPSNCRDGHPLRP